MMQSPDVEPDPLPPASRNAEAERLAGIRILVVEDHEDAAEVLQMLLSNRGAQTAKCHTGSDCLVQCSRAQFDVVLLDLSLPDLSSLEVARRLRAECHPLPRLVALTAYVDNPEPGLFDLFLIKPVGGNELAQQIQRLLGSTAPDQRRPRG